MEKENAIMQFILLLAREHMDGLRLTEFEGNIRKVFSYSPQAFNRLVDSIREIQSIESEAQGVSFIKRIESPITLAAVQLAMLCRQNDLEKFEGFLKMTEEV